MLQRGKKEPSAREEKTNMPVYWKWVLLYSLVSVSMFIVHRSACWFNEFMQQTN